MRLVLEPARPVAQELGISDNVLYRWRSERRHAEVHGVPYGLSSPPRPRNSHA